MLEDRRLLSITVDTLFDESDGSIVDGDISLRDAIEAAPAGEIIDFSVTGTIQLTLQELLIDRSLTINGPGADLLTIDASTSFDSRVFEVDDGDSEALLDVVISGLTLTGGDVGDNGGAIQTSENLTVTRSTISGNAAFIGGGIYGYSGTIAVHDSVISGNLGGGIGGYGDLIVTDSTITGNIAEIGGGIYGYYGNITVTNSTISNNSASGSGGGIYARYVTVTGSTISGNSADSGGGIYAGYVSVTNSTISGNSAGDRGGGIYNYGDLTVTDSTISGNSADTGGGIYSSTDLTGIRTSIQNSTISGNIASSAGGGLFNYNGLTVIEFSTVTLNQAPGGAGGGVASYGDTYTRTRVRSSIIAGNVGGDVEFVYGSTNSFQSTGYNLIGAGNAVGRFNQPGDQTSIADPMLEPLADNGGPTMTHALRAGSPAIDGGNPSAVAGSGGVPMFDQRGTPYGRIVNGNGSGGARIDIGAFELQPIIDPALPGDYNASGTVDAADYVIWRKTMNNQVTAYSGADGSGNGVVDPADHDVWRTNFGRSPSSVGTTSAATAVSAPAETNAPAQEAGAQPLAAPSLAPLSDALFTALGQRNSAGRVAAVAKMAWWTVAVDAAVSDPLLVLHLGRDGPTHVEVFARSADQGEKNSDKYVEATCDANNGLQPSAIESHRLRQMVIGQAKDSTSGR
jgi:predicted outer membrane repeat protein